MRGASTVMFAAVILYGALLFGPLLLKASHDLSNTRLGRIHEKYELHSASVSEGEQQGHA